MKRIDLYLPSFYMKTFRISSKTQFNATLDVTVENLTDVKSSKLRTLPLGRPAPGKRLSRPAEARDRQRRITRSHRSGPFTTFRSLNRGPADAASGRLSPSRS